MVGTGISLTPMPQSEAISIIEKEGSSLKYTRINPEADPKNLDDDVVQKELQDYEKWAKKEPEKARSEAEYPGY